MSEETLFGGMYEAKEVNSNGSIIKVIGVGGGGGNAVKHMYEHGIVGVDFMICNTDSQVLEKNPVPKKMMLGDTGLGAGAIPEVAKKLAENSRDKIKQFIGDDTKMLFISAGMGKGTGTGAAPVIAEIAREMDILTIAVVTFPFYFEGTTRAKYADEGIEELKKHVDSLIVVNNENLLTIYADEEADDAFGFANDVLKNAVKCIAELITVEAIQNIDFKDIETVMKNSGPAMLGLAQASGPNRIKDLVEGAFSCPLLDENMITNAKNFLFFVSYGKDAPLKMSELSLITKEFDKYKSKNSDVIWGHTLDEELGDQLKLSVIVTNYKTNEKPIETDLVDGEKEIEIVSGDRGKEKVNQPVPEIDSEIKEPEKEKKFDSDINTLLEEEPAVTVPAEGGKKITFSKGSSFLSQLGTSTGVKYDSDETFNMMQETPAFERVKLISPRANNNSVSLFEQSDMNALYNDRAD